MSTDTDFSFEQIRYGLQKLGVEAGQVVMLHASLRAIGSVAKVKKLDKRLRTCSMRRNSNNMAYSGLSPTCPAHLYKSMA